MSSAVGYSDETISGVPGSIASIRSAASCLSSASTAGVCAVSQPLEFLHVGTLHRRQWLVRFRMGLPVGVDPVAQSSVMDTEIPGHLRDRFTGLDHHLHRLGLELGTEPATLFGHEHILSVERTCPRSLIHLPPTLRSRLARVA
jgi:hypothetical protein